jgi:hypothetical protein
MKGTASPSTLLLQGEDVPFELELIGTSSNVPLPLPLRSNSLIKKNIFFIDTLEFLFLFFVSKNPYNFYIDFNM